MPTNTQMNVGIRRMIYSLPSPEYRNFEQVGQLYQAISPNLEYNYVVYANGQTIPFDGGGSPKTFYTNTALLEIYFNAGMIDPIN